MKKKKLAKTGRKPNLKAIRLTYELVKEKGLPYREASKIIQKRLKMRKEPNTKSLYRWLQYQL